MSLLFTNAGERYLTITTDILTEDDKRPLWLKDVKRATKEWIEGPQDPALDEFDQQLEADLNINLVSYLIVKMDMATMANSLEARSPSLNRTL